MRWARPPLSAPLFALGSHARRLASILLACYRVISREAAAWVGCSQSVGSAVHCLECRPHSCEGVNEEVPQIDVRQRRCSQTRRKSAARVISPERRVWRAGFGAITRARGGRAATASPGSGPGAACSIRAGFSEAPVVGADGERAAAAWTRVIGPARTERNPDLAHDRRHKDEPSAMLQLGRLAFFPAHSAPAVASLGRTGSPSAQTLPLRLLPSSHHPRPLIPLLPSPLPPAWLSC